MRQLISLFVIPLTLSGVLLLTACGTSGTQYDSVNYNVYSGYNYPYYGSGGYYYDDDDDGHHHHDDDHDRPDRPHRPDRPDNRPVNRPGGGMGRPSGGTMRGGGGGRGGGRGRR